MNIFTPKNITERNQNVALSVKNTKSISKPMSTIQDY